MYWQEEQQDEQHFVVDDGIVDLHFRIESRGLPVDHARPLYDALIAHLPWLGEDHQGGVHGIHGGGSQNGWERPEQPDALLYPSRRTPLVLRLPRARVEQARALEGAKLDIAGNELRVGPAKSRPLRKATTLYARHVHFPELAAGATNDASEEGGFIEAAAKELRRLGIGFKKILCGKPHVIQDLGREIPTRSLMVADLSLDDAVRLQQLGLGDCHHLGCGLFVPHKPV